MARLHPDHNPMSVEAEQMVLGALLLEPERVGQVIRAGGTDLFNDPVHAAVFEVLAKRDRDGMLVSPVTVGDAMRSHDGLRSLGGPGYLVRLAGSAPAPSSVKGYAQLLGDLRQKRKLVAAMAEAQASILRGEEAAHIIAGRLEAALIDAAPSDGAGPVSMMSAVTTALAQVKAAYEGTDDTGVKSGIYALDKMIGGFFPGELILIGGRPSMGKTGVALSMALNAARAGHGVCIASLEMNPEAMAIRALSEQTAHQRLATSYAQMRRGEMTDDQVEGMMHAAREVAALPIMFLSRHFSDLGALLAGAKQAQRAMDGRMRLMIVDYAQLLKSNAKGRYEQITEISIALKALAGQLNVPVIALSQLSRAVEQREDKRPMLSDLRESGQLEQDADAVLFCYRDEYYVERERPAPDDPLEDHEDWAAAMEKARNRLEIIVAKQRQGEVGTARVRFNPAINLIWED
ncbi:replicative DNA helicase [Falsirhodobacter sp. 1013]|uniref:replicative DNA helicase n=1 Tax=Falsirhodobacter sp. 1013 TaxID=3417566 RepID=UPI003EBB9EDD